MRLRDLSCLHECPAQTVRGKCSGRRPVQEQLWLPVLLPRIERAMAVLPVGIAPSPTAVQRQGRACTGWMSPPAPPVQSHLRTRRCARMSGQHVQAAATLTWVRGQAPLAAVRPARSFGRKHGRRWGHLLASVEAELRLHGSRCRCGRHPPSRGCIPRALAQRAERVAERPLLIGVERRSDG